MKPLLPLAALALLVSCGKKAETPVPQGCSIPSKTALFHMADSVVKARKENKNIWNLSEVDSTDIFMAEDYFTNAKTKSIVALVNGSAGLSAGSADNLIMLLECKGNRYKVAWAGQGGEFDATDIRDLNNDGMKEIICESGMVWMGGCYDYYTITSFKGGRENTLFTSESVSLIDCGLEDYGNRFFAVGDTLENTSTYKIIPQGKKYAVEQTRTLKLKTREGTNAEILSGLKVSTDIKVTPIP